MPPAGLEPATFACESNALIHLSYGGTEKNPSGCTGPLGFYRMSICLGWSILLGGKALIPYPLAFHPRNHSLNLIDGVRWSSVVPRLELSGISVQMLDADMVV